MLLIGNTMPCLEVYMIDDKPVIVTDTKKIKEIKEALKSSKS